MDLGRRELKPDEIRVPMPETAKTHNRIWREFRKGKIYPEIYSRITCPDGSVEIRGIRYQDRQSSEYKEALQRLCFHRKKKGKGLGLV